MKKVAILPRKYYTKNSINYVAGQEVVVSDDEAEQMEADNVGQIVGEANEEETLKEIEE